MSLAREISMNAPTTVCVVGSANVDLIFRTERLPARGETLAASDMRVGSGGKGANQAVMAALLRARVSLVARVGSDSFGRQLVDNLNSYGVDTTHTCVDPNRTTGVASIMVDDDAHNCIIVSEGANGRLSPADVQAAGEVLSGARVLVCQLETPIAATMEAFRIARGAGGRTILNPAPAKPLPQELLQLTDVCVPNETEAALLTGIDTSTPEGAREAARVLKEQGPRAVIITLGSRGCLVDDESGVAHFPAWRTLAVDPTGAGDAFVGALAASLAAGVSLRAALPRASAAAALSVSKPGAQASFPSVDEVDAFMRQSSASD
jgi:ribokinase